MDPPAMHLTGSIFFYPSPLAAVQTITKKRAEPSRNRGLSLQFFEQMAALCRMKYEQPVYSFGTAYIPGFSTEEDRKRVLDTADRHAQRLLERLKELES